MPDYYNTFFRNYDQALGRFIAIDPLAEQSESLTGYQYSVNNPIMFNDPLGDRERPQLMEMPREDCGCGGGGSGSGLELPGRIKPGINYNYLTQMAFEAEREGQQIRSDGVRQAVDNARAMGGVMVYHSGAKGDLGNFKSVGSRIDNAMNDDLTGMPNVLAQVNICANQGGGDPTYGGPLAASSLLGHYLGGRGGDYFITKNEFNAFLNTMKQSGELDRIRNKGIPVPNVEGLYQVTVNTYGTKYENAVGLGTLHYNQTGIIGFSDWWNFDPKPWGTRSIPGEALTRFGHSLDGDPFYVIYGSTPPISNIPRH
jgi:hypothetical protein